ncbi:MAG: TetR/AcrR family transcriptional regulator [Pseudomonadota bacterium]
MSEQEQSATKPVDAKPGRRRRLSPEERERMIVAGAIRYFAEQGFDGETRALANSIGVSQALIFHYFPTKSALIDRVYEEVFLSRWKVAWIEILGDRSRSLRHRLKDFYRDYYTTADRPEWIRITLYSSLRDIDINARYFARVRKEVILRIAREVRVELGFGDSEEEITESEEQMVYCLHSAVIYALIRKHVYSMPGPQDPLPIIEANVDLYMNSIPLVLQRFLGSAASAPDKKE